MQIILFGTHFVQRLHLSIGIERFYENAMKHLLQTSRTDLRKHFFFPQMPTGAQCISNESLFSVVLKYISMTSPKKKHDLSHNSSALHSGV